MDYEKLYKEALERARTGKPMNEVFPELHEGEDEWIRKHIIEILNRLAPCHWDGNEKARCIAYLEKQKEQKQIKKGDKVKIHCRKDRKKDMVATYDGKVGEVIYVWDAQRNPWGHIGVRLDDGRNNGFYEDELEILDEPHWKPNEEQLGALNYAYCELFKRGDVSHNILSHLQNLIDTLENL